MALVRTLSAATKLVNRTGLLLVFPIDDLVLPSLWEAATGTREVVVFDEDDSGRKHLSPELDRVWSLKDRLASGRSVCVGKHVRDRLVCVSLDVLPSLYVLTGRRGRADDFRSGAELRPIERDVAEALLESGPRTAPQVRALLGTRDTRACKKAIETLQRALVVTQAGAAEQEQGWAASIFDLTARRFASSLRKLPKQDEARVTLTAVGLKACGELTAADLAPIYGFGRTEAAALLGRLEAEGRARRRDEDGYAIWSVPRMKA